MDDTKLEAIVCAILAAGAMASKPKSILDPAPATDAVNTYFQVRQAMQKRGGPFSAQPQT